MFEDVIQLRFLVPGFTPHPQRFFCAFCIYPSDNGEGFFNVSAVQTHLRSAHKVDTPLVGHDFFDALDLVDALARWRELQDAEADALAPWIESLIGPDDFLLECGE